MEKVERIKELTKELNKYRDSYYNDSKSLISDYEYDNLYDELQKLEDETGLSFANSPTKTVGYEVKSELKKVKHSHPMLSLAKTKSEQDLIKFASNKDYILSCKMDGLTCLLTYNNGVLQSAETRGNAYEGEDITHTAKVFENIPLTIPYKGLLEVEGEAIISNDDFRKINDKLPDDKKYKNPRNLVSGSVRQLDSKIAKDRHIRFIAWKVPKIEGNISTFLERFNYIEDLGFEIVPYVATNDNDAEHIDFLIDNLKSIANKLSYGIDGLVMTYNDIRYGESLGMTGHHPKHSIAFKFYDEEVETTLLDMEWSMGKSGQLTPVAIFKPVEIDGTIIERASVHNVSILTELDLQIGDTITVYKANQIIPQIKENLSAKGRESTYVEIIGYCPVCGEPTEIKKDNDTQVLMCTNPHCKGKLLGRLSHFVSKKGMNIDGLSEETLKKFIDLGWLNNIFDIYNLHVHFDELSKMDGFGARSVKKLQDAIEKSKTVDLQHFITALSIPNIGTSQSKELLKRFKTWEEFEKAGFGSYNFANIEGFGSVLNKNIHTWFNTMWNEDKIGELVKIIAFATDDNSAKSDKLNGKTFVITGSLTHYPNRDALKSAIESMGGKVSGSVSKNTFALINNNVNSTSSKNKKAKDLGVQIITEEQFIELVK